MLETGTRTPEGQLIHLAQQGDREAFGELVRRYRLAVINVVYRMCGDARLAEDAAQEAFIRAWQRLPAYRPQASFRSWLCRIALNAAVDALRRERPEQDLETVSLTAGEAQPEASLEQRQRLEQVRRAVLSLPDASRAVLVLREYEGLSYQEIAEALDISIGTVMSRLNYARNRLAQSLHLCLEEA